MTEIIIIEESFLIRYALKKLILEIDERYRLHELASVSGLENLMENIDDAVVIINRELLPPDHQKYFAGMNIRRSGIVLFTCKDEAERNPEGMIFLKDAGTSVLKKLKEVLGTEKDRQNKSSGSKTLSDRETGILRCVALGMTNREIAGKFFLSTHTVIAHRKNISAKLGIKTIAGFTVYALLNNIILPDDISK
jgi:DNA-binding CsgD family transcriptional regulator